MKNELKVNGTQKFMGFDIPVIEGGFGEGCRVIAAKTIAEIHGLEVKRINELIKNNLKRFKENIDIIDILQREELKDGLSVLGLKGSNRTKNVYLLSERGYAKLIKAMDSDKAWEIHDKLIDEYFAMRQVINSDDTKKANLLLSIYDGGQEAIIACRELSNLEVKKATTPLLQKIEDDEPYTTFARHVEKSDDSVDVGEFAKLIEKQNIFIGRNRLFAWLKDHKYLMTNNIPYQKYIENKYFQVIEIVKKTDYGTNIFMKTLITGKGQVALTKKLKAEFDLTATA